jgi:hypothetical protein
MSCLRRGDLQMNYDTVVPELLSRFPTIKATYHDPDWDDLPYLVFGCVLIPALEADLKLGDTDEIVSLCSFIEECAVCARQDNMLAELIKVEIGEWLQEVTYREGLAPFLGRETKRLCL